MGDSSTFARLTRIKFGAGSNGSKVAALDGRHDLTDQTPLLGLEMFEELQSDMAKISEESKSGMDEIRLLIADNQQNMAQNSEDTRESKAGMDEIRLLIADNQQNMARNSEETRGSIAGIQQIIGKNSEDSKESIAGIQQSMAKNSEESKAEMIEMRQLIESLSRESSSSHDAFLKDAL